MSFSAETSETKLLEEPSKKRRRKKKKFLLLRESAEHVKPSDTTSAAVTHDASNSGVTAATKRNRKRKTSTQTESSSVSNNDSQHANIAVNDDASELSKKFKSNDQNLSAELSQGSVTYKKLNIIDIASKDRSRQMTANPEMSASKKKRKKKAKGTKQSMPLQQNTQVPALKVSDSRLKAYGLNPKKLKKQLIYGKRKDTS